METLTQRLPHRARYILYAMLLPLLTACVSSTHIKSLAKTDIDTVADLHIQTMDKHLAAIITMLYEHNPEELKKNPKITVEMRVNQALYHAIDVVYPEVNNLQKVSAIKLGLSPDFRGDRVFALSLGIGGMLRYSYNGLNEVFIADQLDPQSLYDSARNLEIVLTRLNDLSEDTDFSLGPRADEINSLHAHLQRMVGLQDMMAQISASASQRLINTLVRKATLIPIGGL